MINKGLMSSNTDEWATPISLYNELNKEFHFTLDPCSTKENHKCETYFTKEDNGLEKSWGNYRVYMNPPYRKANWIMDSKSIRGKPKGNIYCSITTSKNRHKVVSRIHI